MRTRQGQQAAIAHLLACGAIFTAAQFNLVTHGNDARKVISRLRREGMPIGSRRRSSDGRNYYFLTDKRITLL